MTTWIKSDHGPLISSIIIFFNVEKYLQEAIDSVVSQTFTNWELILVDDGSSDFSTEIAKRFVQRHPNNMVYVEHEGHQNLGMSASRNLGVKFSKGNYIAFLDADDIWHPQKLERQFAVLEAHPEAAVAFSPWQEWQNKVENNEGQGPVQNLGVDPNRVIQPAHLIPLWLQSDSRIPGHCGSFWRREAILHAGGFEDSFRDYYEDLVLLVKVHLEAPVYVGGECFSKYRQHEESSCALLENEGKDHQAKLKFYHWLEDYLMKKNIHDQAIWEILQKRLVPYRRPIMYRLLRLMHRAKRRLSTWLRGIARKILPVPVYDWLRTQWNNRKAIEAWSSD